MTALAMVSNAYTPRLCFASTGPSSAITDSTAETVFDQVCTLPSQSQHIYVAPATARIEAYGFFSTGALFTTCTFRLRLGGLTGTILATTGSITLPASQTDAGWYLDALALFTVVGSAGTVEAHGQLQAQSGLLTLVAPHLDTTGAQSVDQSNALNLVITAQWGTAQASNSLQLRSSFVEINGP